MLRTTPLLLALASTLAFAGVARADDPPADAAAPATTPGTTPDPATPDPAATTEPAPTPTPAAPEPTVVPTPPPPPKKAPVTLVEQAGVGGEVGYGKKGVLELGGSAGLVVATNMRDVNFSPSIGWFLADSVELSAIFGVSHIRTDMESSTLITALVEPSYHLQLGRGVFGFFGLGVGGSYIKGVGGGFAVAPRLGANMLVGRSGILTPSVSWQYTTHSVAPGASENMIDVSSALRINVGYTVMW